MTTNAQIVASFLEAQGHRTAVEHLDPNEEAVLVRFRARGTAFFVATSQSDPTFFTLTTTVMLPTWARDQAQGAPIVLALQNDYKAVKFFYGDEDTLVASIEQFSASADEFVTHLWRCVGIIREASSAAITRIIDRGESRAAAEKFINDFMRGSE